MAKFRLIATTTVSLFVLAAPAMAQDAIAQSEKYGRGVHKVSAAGQTLKRGTVYRDPRASFGSVYVDGYYYLDRFDDAIAPTYAPFN